MSLANPPRLFIPGPVQVEPEILQAQCHPMIGHRAPEFTELASKIHEMLHRLFRTEDPVCVGTTSATGIMEAAVRNCARDRVLCCVNGAFSDRWHGLCVSNGIAADRLEFGWGEAVKPDRVAEALATGKYDAVTVVANETSTGVLSPLEDIARVVKSHDDVMLLVDAVTALATVPIETAAWKIDVLLAGSQKGLALPPGLTVFSISQAAQARRNEVGPHGGYVDFVSTLKSYAKHQTPNTPAVSLMYALSKRLEGILADEGAWYGAHLERAELTRAWARDRFALFPEQGYESISLTCIENTRGISVAGLNEFLRERGVILSNGYGDLKEKTFRIGHMGDNDLAWHQRLLDWIDEYLQK